nr:VWA domain-containing protein [Akkermansiaceae bacterium]
MSIIFQHPALLGLLALAAVPLLVHLLSRARPPVYRFSDVGFLRRVLRTTARMRRPKDWLLLALRTLGLAALAAAFAAPLLVSRDGEAPGERTTSILLVDRSASMAAREGLGTRLDAACAAAAAYLEQARPQHANLIWIDAEPDGVFPAPGPNISFLAEALQQARPVPESGPPAAALTMALRQLAAAGGRRELVVISDFQASVWRDFAPKLPAGIALRTQRTATTAPANIALTRILPQPAEPVVGQEVTVLVEVRNFSAEPVATRVTLDADGALQSQPARMVPWGEAQVAFVVRPAAAGPMPVTTALAGDAADLFPADDTRHAVVRVRDSLRLAITAAAPPAEEPLLRRLASALAWLEIVPPGQSAAPDFTYHAAWQGESPEALAQAAAEGVVQIVRPAPGCPVGAVRTLMGMPPATGDGPLAPEASAAGWEALPARDHPATRLFEDAEFGNPFGGRFRERVKLPANLTAQGVRPVATYADGIPAVLERTTAGAPVLLWNLPLDPAKTDWPTRGAFLPAIAELLLRSRPQTTSDAGEIAPGARVAWSSADPAHTGAVSLLGPDGSPIGLTESADAEGTRWQAASPAVPGLYRWLISGQPIAHTAVNFPAVECDLRPLEANPAFGKLDAGAKALVNQAALAKGIPLWPWLVL